MATERENNKECADIHDALSHKRRVAILNALREGPLGFAELKRKLNIESSGTLQHHLLKMNGLIKNELGNYSLTDKGKGALLDFPFLDKYNEDARFREQVGLLIRALRSEIVSIEEIVVVQLTLLGPNTIPYLTSALAQALVEAAKDSKERRYYSESSEREASENAIRGLVKALGIISAPSTVVSIATALPRSEAFEALAKIGNKQALDVVIQSMPSWYAQKLRERRYESEEQELEIDNFSRKIFSYFDEDGRMALESALVDEANASKYIIARILAVVGDDKSVAPLLTALEKGDFATKKEAAKALKRLKATEAVGKLVDELIKTEDLLSSSRDGSSSIKDEDYANDACKAFVDALLELGSIDDWVTIAFHRPRDEDFARPFDRALIKAKDQAVPALTKLLQAPDQSVQKAAAEMIHIIKSGNDRSDYYSSYRY